MSSYALAAIIVFAFREAKAATTAATMTTTRQKNGIETECDAEQKQNQKRNTE